MLSVFITITTMTTSIATSMHDCHECGGCDPMTETLALMQYMINHNAAHARELEGLAKKLGELGNEAAAQQVLAAVSEFEKGNVRLSAVLASLK